MDLLVLPQVTDKTLNLFLESHYKVKQVRQNRSPLLFQIKHQLQQVMAEPKFVLGSTSTSALCWLAALKAFPDAEFIIEQLDAQDISSCIQLSDFKPFEGMKQQSKTILQSDQTASHTDPEILKQTEIQEAESEAPAFNENKLLDDMFIRYVWGEGTHKIAINNYKNQFMKHADDQEKAIKKLIDIRLLALKAVSEFDHVILPELNADTDFKLIEANIRANYKKEPYRLRSHLIHNLYKYQKRVENCPQTKVYPKFSTVKPISLRGRGHPNTVSSLPVSNEYQVFIDETGLNFGASEDVGAQGRYVGIVIPASISLPEQQGFHATDVSSTPEKIDRVVDTLLSYQVGIIGFSAADQQIQGTTEWFGGVCQLIKWITYLLPENAEERKIKVVIENRADYTIAMKLDVLQAMFHHELSMLDTSFSNTYFECSFADKNDPILPYADAIAYSWGTKNNRVSKDRLKKTQLLGHCLFDPSVNTFEKLYMLVNGKGKLQPSEWYSLCAGLPDQDQGEKWIHRYMDKVALLIKQNKTVWFSYLALVRNKLALKEYKIQELAKALQFLEDATPVKESFPMELELQLVSSKLALQSHLGNMDEQLFEQACGLIQKIYPENALLACESILRLFSMSSNVFDFERIKPLIKVWLGQNQLTVGRLNHAKLNATMGQIYAFEGETALADKHFNKALQLISLLNDKNQQIKEELQVRCYQLTVYLQSDSHQDQAIQALNLLCQKSGLTIQKIACAHVDTFPYIHHVVTKALALRSEWFFSEMLEYLEYENRWQIGEYHPWQWIAFNRALMMLQTGRTGYASQFTIAIEACAHDGAIFGWMQLVMAKVANQFEGYQASFDVLDATEKSKELKAELIVLLDLSFSSDIQSIRIFISKCLPFNFH